MPLRRRPSDPSPRLRALLEAPDRRTFRGVERPEPAVTQMARPVSRSSQSAPEPWLPLRSWVQAPAHHPVRDRASASLPPDHGAKSPRAGRHRRQTLPGPRFLTVPLSLRDARINAPRAAVIGLLAVVVVAGVGFSARVAWARAASAPQAVAPTAHPPALTTRGAASAAFGSTTASAAGAAAPAGAPSASTLVVHVVGRVRHPGVLSLPAGSRVADAVAKAGGSLPGADLAAINLARALVDGEQVRVPKPGEPATTTGPAAGDAASAGASPGAAGPVDLNSASAAQLEDLPGVGPVLAQRIIDWRTQHGRFASVDELGEVTGIGDKIFGQLQSKVTV